MSNVNNSTLGDNLVLIVENVGIDLDIKSSNSNNIVLEGICAVFGEENNNHRVYEKEEYLPHLSYLTEKINNGQLVGDLDHPPHFDVTLKSASHIIEHLEYDGDNKVNIRLRILEDTPNGKIAKALIQGGVNLSISSRAAGEVLNEGRVRLHRIFTYDLVGEPGFTQAVLRKTVNESLKTNFKMLTESYDHLKDDSFVNKNKLVDISESLKFNDNFKIYKINNTIEPKIFENSIHSENNNNKMDKNDTFVSNTALHEYSNLVAKEFSKINAKFKKASDLNSVNESSDLKQGTMELVSYVNEMKETVNGLVKYTNYLSSKLNKTAGYAQYVGKKANEAIGYSSYIGSELSESIRHNDYMVGVIEDLANYSDYIKEGLNGSINYQNYLAKELDKGIQFTEYVAESSNNIEQFTKYLSENVNQNREFGNYLAEKAGQGIGYTEYLVKSLNSTGKAGKRDLIGNVGRLTESANIDDLLSKVDTVISEVTSDSSKAVLESKYPFLKVMNEDNKQKFYKLETKDKKAIVEALSGSMWFNENDVLGIMDAVLNESNKDIPSVVRFMPDTYKHVYGKMNENEKGRLFSKSQLYTLNTPYQVKSFWDEYNFRGINERIEIEASNNKMQQKLNESQGTEGMISVESMVEQSRGYSSNYLDALKRRGSN